jgi:hypothetical protein
MIAFAGVAVLGAILMFTQQRLAANKWRQK